MEGGYDIRTVQELPGRNDNTLCEQSLARPEAVAEAASVTVLENATHQTIVSDAETIARVNELLTAYRLSITDRNSPDQ